MQPKTYILTTLIQKFRRQKLSCFPQNASINNYSEDSSYLKGLANQITNRTETKLKGTSRLIIWDRISGDIIFEGKGLDLTTIYLKLVEKSNLQNLTHKNFG